MKVHYFDSYKDPFKATDLADTDLVVCGDSNEPPVVGVVMGENDPTIVLVAGDYQHPNHWEFKRSPYPHNWLKIANGDYYNSAVAGIAIYAGALLALAGMDRRHSGRRKMADLAHAFGAEI